MRVAFVENHDSFSWNVIDLLPCERAEVEVVPGAVATLARLAAADLVVVGPGPMDPERAGLVGLVLGLAERGRPVLGVCLGHQALGLAFGARLVRTTPVHGKTSRVRFEGARLFAGMDGEHEVMRYHSLALSDVPAPLRVVGTTDDGVVMAVEHATLPLAGVQFHPDSYATPIGRALVAAYFAEALR